MVASTFSYSFHRARPPCASRIRPNKLFMAASVDPVSTHHAGPAIVRDVMTSTWIAALVALGACAGGSGGKALAHDFDNTGRVCLCATDDFFCEDAPQQ